MYKTRDGFMRDSLGLARDRAQHAAKRYFGMSSPGVCVVALLIDISLARTCVK